MSLIKELAEAIAPAMPYYHINRRIAEVLGKHPLQSFILVVLVYGGLGYGGYKLYQSEKQKEETERKTNLSYTTQLESLNQTEENLKNLISYIDNQKVKLKESQDIITQLESEHARMQPIVNADKEVVDAIFGAQEARQSKSRRLGYIISFVLGVMSSLTATFIVYVIAIRRRKNDRLPNQNMDPIVTTPVD